MSRFRRHRLLTLAIVAIGLLGMAGVSATAPAPERAAKARPLSDSSDVAATVARFHAAMAAGDSAAALLLLADDVVILESGEAESRDEFRSGHLAADIAYARAVATRRGPAIVWLRGDVAWVSTTATNQGEFRGRTINSRGAELMVLSREAGGWKIRAIHWSSRAVRPG